MLYVISVYIGPCYNGTTLCTVYTRQDNGTKERDRDRERGGGSTPALRVSIGMRRGFCFRWFLPQKGYLTRQIIQIKNKAL